VDEELQELIDNNPEWYKNLLYTDVKGFIRDNINSAARSFVAIGYYLKYARDNELYIEDGYNTLWEFAQSEFGIGKSSASSFMGINDKFSKDGNSPILLEQYKDFSSSKLSEMLTLTDEQLEKVVITTTRAEIREMKQPEKVEPVPEETVLHAERTELPKSPSLDDLELSVRAYNCLKHADIDTVEQLCNMTEDEISKVRNLGLKCVVEVKEKLREIGKELNSDKPVGEDGCTGECFWCTDEKCNCHQELRENCLFDANIKCSIYGARQVATTTCGIDCKSNCCMNCSEDCGARCNHSAHFGLMKSTVVETVELIPEAKKSDWEKGIFEDDTEAYGWSRSTTVISLIEQLITDNVEVDNINGDYCEAHGNTYYVYIVNGYIEFEDENQKLLFKTDINRFKHEFEWHKKRLETMPDLSGDEEPEDDIDESENDEPKIVDNEPKSENDMNETDPEEVETIEADIIQSEPEELPGPVFSAEHHLREAIQREEEQLNQLGETWKRKQPDTFLKHETILIALKLFLTDMEYPVPEVTKTIQPELQGLKNNDQRKAFLDAYETWPIWINQKETNEKYYRYDFTNGDSFVVKVSLYHPWESKGYSKDTKYGCEEYYMLGVKANYSQSGTVFKKDASVTFSESKTNKSSLIDYLKEIQKK